MGGLRPPWPVRLVSRQQPNNQSNQLAGGKNDSPLVTVLAHFMELALIESLVVSIVQPDDVGGFAKVVAQVGVAGPAQGRVLRLEIS